MTEIDLVLARQTIPPKWTGCLSPEEVIQQVFDAGKTQGKTMTIAVEGEHVCSYCRSDIRKAADKAGLESVTIFEKESGNLLIWTRREDGKMGKIKEIPRDSNHL